MFLNKKSAFLFSTFNPEAFLGTTTSEVMDTKVTLVPEGVYKAQVMKVTVSKLEARDGKEEMYPCEIFWGILDDKVAADIGIPTPQVKQTIWLDVNKEGALESGKNKNVQLGKIRDALGLNKPGKKFALSHLNGGMASVMVKHAAAKPPSEDVYANVTKVVAG